LTLTLGEILETGDTLETLETRETRETLETSETLLTYTYSGAIYVPLVEGVGGGKYIFFS